MKIDFVIPWVDGSDKEWLKEKAKYDPNVDLNADNIDARYRNWDNLQYLFRSIEKYAPWVNKVYFITWGHLPKWMNVDNPKLVIVNHKDYIPKEYLPTFNSHTIELNMHRINGLSEHFVYLNDDMFFIKPVKETDFFKKGLPCDHFGLYPIYFAPDSAGAYNGNDLEIINKHFNIKEQYSKYKWKYLSLKNGYRDVLKTIFLSKFGWFPGFKYDHLANSFLKSTLEKVWEEEYDILDSTCKDKFRNKRNVNQWLFKFWQYADGKFYPRSRKFGKVYHLKGYPRTGLKEAIESHKFSLVCINDTKRTTDFDKHKKLVNDALNSILPDKSSFEK